MLMQPRTVTGPGFSGASEVIVYLPVRLNLGSRQRANEVTGLAAPDTTRAVSS